MEVEGEGRRLETDLTALASLLRADREFADQLYCALCNSDWRHDDGTKWSGSWRYAAGLIADLRESGEDWAALGWHGTGHGRPLWMFDFRTGESKVWVDGRWVAPEEAPE